MMQFLIIAAVGLYMYFSLIGSCEDRENVNNIESPTLSHQEFKYRQPLSHREFGICLLAPGSDPLAYSPTEYEALCQGRKIEAVTLHYLGLNHYSTYPKSHPDSKLFVATIEQKFASIPQLERDDPQGLIVSGVVAGDFTNPRIDDATMRLKRQSGEEVSEPMTSSDGSSVEDSRQTDLERFSDTLSTEPVRSSFNAEEWAAQNRADALMQQAEDDAELAKYAQETRAEYKSKAIRYQSTSRGGVTIDSFELPGDVFIACTLSFPGPVYACDETASAAP